MKDDYAINNKMMTGFTSDPPFDVGEVRYAGIDTSIVVVQRIRKCCYACAWSGCTGRRVSGTQKVTLTTAITRTVPQ